jgi:hypothetical protein
MYSAHSLSVMGRRLLLPVLKTRHFELTCDLSPAAFLRQIPSGC